MKRIPILMYHQIDTAPPRGSPLRGLVVSPRTFWWHLLALKLLGYRGLSMSELEPYLRGDCSGRVVGITFDDGFANNLTHALPLLTRFGFTSTCYVVANHIGQYNQWDAQHGIAQVPLMNALQLKQWVAAGQEVGSHSLTHANLPNLTQEQQWREITQSKVALEALVPQVKGVRHFCYPYGALDQVSVRAVAAAGYTTATTTVRGRVVVGPEQSLLELPRVLVSRTTTWFHLLLKCFTDYETRRGHANTRGAEPAA
jgi:peptidoglycan/xylan/chitin deacetylase (PgdA/CDA1 family)